MPQKCIYFWSPLHNIVITVNFYIQSISATNYLRLNNVYNKHNHTVKLHNTYYNIINDKNTYFRVFLIGKCFHTFREIRSVMCGHRELCKETLSDNCIKFIERRFKDSIRVHFSLVDYRF